MLLSFAGRTTGPALPADASGVPALGLSLPPDGLGYSAESSTADGWGNWTGYNGIIFGSATLYQSQSGGGLAVQDSLSVQSDYAIGSTYSTEYDATQHIGEYRNEDELPALLFGGSRLDIGEGVASLDVFGGPIVMSAEMLAYNSSLPTGFAPQTHSAFAQGDQAALEDWFDYQYAVVGATSQLLMQANDETISLSQLSDGSYMDAGPQRYRNQRFQVNGTVHENALFITVRTPSDLSLGQWWPVYSILTLDADWAIEYDLLVFNFPDAVNVTMNSSAFQISNMHHWSTTVDAWVGEQGMEVRRALAEKVVYNFPNARTVEANHALVQGTVLAPQATFTGVGAGDEGHIYGHIVARDYIARGNFTIHAFSLSPWIYDIVEDALQDSRETGSLTLRHYLYFHDDPTRIRVGGGDFILIGAQGYYDGNGGFSPDPESAAVYTTSQEDYTVIPRLPLGEYTLRHTRAPDGFLLNTTVPGKSHTYYHTPVTLTAGDPHPHVVRYSEPQFTDAHFRKVDAETGEELAGATFTILREADEYEDTTVGNTYTSGSDGHFTSHNLPVGNYHLIEVETPEGYHFPQDSALSFSVYWDSQTETLRLRDADGSPLTASASSPLEIRNLSGVPQNSISVVKYASNSPDAASYTLPGAEFSLHRYDAVLDDWDTVTENAAGEQIQIVTNDLGFHRVDNLEPGIYRLVETKAPAGYRLLNRYTDEAHSAAFPQGYAYQVAISGDASYYTAYIPNTALTADITVSVEGMVLEERIPLSGATFQLEHLLQDGATWEELLFSVETGLDGQIRLERLSAGTYRLTQRSAATGFYPLAPASIVLILSFNEQGLPTATGFYDSHDLSSDTAPASLHTTNGLLVDIENQAKTRDFFLYKIDGDSSVGRDEQDTPAYPVTYLEGAVFRLQRRQDVRSPWVDYGPAFTSTFQYDEDGLPMRDSYGNHIATATFEEGLLYGDYHLVEMEPPDGYSPTSGVPVTLNDGSVGRQVHLFTITEAMTGTGQHTSYTIANYSLSARADFHFRKVDSADYSLPLRGARFALYSCERNHIHDEFLTEDSCWAQDTPIIATSLADGYVRFQDLLSGEYMLRETRAPVGYHLPSATWRVTLNASAGTAETAAAGNLPLPQFTASPEGPLLPNQKTYLLPNMGGQGTAIFWVAGGPLVGAAWLHYHIQYKKRRKK